ncbi:uncharacterized protein LOC142626133 [Castanea sativa]|uniref:uncharacterized protein LOC142626133 n=1 Tax=Castanea sativa TaxID=21020 RepID=UPI003F65143B
MRVPQKVKTFMWQACRNAMPTKEALVKRTIITNPLCDRCRNATESPLHALWSCSEVDVVWAKQSLWGFRNHISVAGFKQLENKSRIGVVVKNEDGLVLGSCTKRLSQAYSALEIEAMAAATALVFASELGVRQAILEGDSMAVIKALKEFEDTLSPSGLLLEDIRMFSQRFDTFLYSHTRREGNSVAHSLARYALSIPNFLVWIEDVPPHIQHFVRVDLVSLS